VIPRGATVFSHDASRKLDASRMIDRAGIRVARSPAADFSGSLAAVSPLPLSLSLSLFVAPAFCPSLAASPWFCVFGPRALALYLFALRFIPLRAAFTVARARQNTRVFLSALKTPRIKVT